VEVQSTTTGEGDEGARTRFRVAGFGNNASACLPLRLGCPRHSVRHRVLGIRGLVSIRFALVRDVGPRLYVRHELRARVARSRIRRRAGAAVGSLVLIYTNEPRCHELLARPDLTPFQHTGHLSICIGHCSQIHDDSDGFPTHRRTCATASGDRLGRSTASGHSHVV
jgi:hypothetical protein